MRAVADDKEVAQICGINSERIIIYTFLLGSALAGIAGSLYAHYITYIDPSSFSILEAILIFSMVIIGGIASNKGAILGAVILILLPEPLRFIGFPLLIYY